MAILISERLRALRAERGWSVSTLSRNTVRPGDEGVGEKTIEAIERNPGRVPDAEIIETLARAFKLKPGELAHHEYPIAVARRDAAMARVAKRERAAAQRSGDSPRAPARTTAARGARRRKAQG